MPRSCGSSWWSFVLVITALVLMLSLQAAAAANPLETGLPPAAPSNLILITAGPDVMLTWTDNSADDLGFLVERAAGDGQWVEIAAPTPNLNSCPDILEANGTYYYRVRAFNNYGTSDYSNVVSYVVNLDYPPDYTYRPEAPSQLQNTGTAAEVVLHWLDNSDRELGFAVEKMAPGGFWSQLGANPANSTDYADRLVGPGTYYYRVKAFNNFGPSRWSNLSIIYNPGPPQPITGNTIALQVGNPLMAVDGNYREIDPGRGMVPVIVAGRALVPVRVIAENLGGTIDWDPIARKVSIRDGERVIELGVGSTIAYIEGKRQEMDVAPLLVNDRTLVPIRFLAENMGAVVEWNEQARTVTISR